METPYFLNPDEDSHLKKVTPSKLPDWCKYHLAFAQNKSSFLYPQIEVISQQLNSKPFFIDLTHLNVKTTSSLKFEIKKRQLFMYFMIKGSVLYVDQNCKPIVKPQTNSFMMSYYDTGIYYSHVEQGEHISLLVSIDPEWVEQMFPSYPNIQNILHRFKHEGGLFNTMYMCRMDRKIQRWLYKIYSYSQNNLGAIDGNLRTYISYLLEHYDKVIGDQQTDMAFAIKSYIQEHFKDNSLTVRSLAEHFYTTDRTLLNTFKRKYSVSVQSFITELRLKLAIILIEEKGLPVKDVYTEVGYADERTFRSALERYINRNK